MKFTIITTATLAVAAAAQPHYAHQHQHLHQAKRQAPQVDVITSVVYTTQVAAIVYVNQDGQPVSTTFIHRPGPTGPHGPHGPHRPPMHSHPTSAFIPPAPVSTNPSPGTPPAVSQPGSSSPPPNPPSGPPSNPSSNPPSNPPSTGSPNSPSNGTSRFGTGLSYSPYNNDGTCKTQDQVTADFAAFNGYHFVRSYGVDCNQASTILAAARAKGMKMFAGIYDINNAAAETQELIAAAQNNWDAIAAVTVGNEAVNDGVASVAQVVAAVTQARSMLRAAGYNGPVATVDTSAQVIANPQLCDVSDFAAANCHAFFNADLTPDGAGPWVREQAQRIAQVCGGKDTLITESGWPSQGEANGLAVPSQENQDTAVQSLREAFSDGRIVLFSAFNNLWKTNSPGTFGAEQWWGIYGDAPA